MLSKLANNRVICLWWCNHHTVKPQQSQQSNEQEVETDLQDRASSSHIYLLVWKIYQFPAWKAFHFGYLLCQISLLGKLDLGTEACDE